MFRFIGIGLGCLVLCVSAAPTQDKKEEAKKDKDAIEYKMDYIDKSWGIKLKSSKIQNDQIHLLLTFGKDVEKEKMAEMRTALIGDNHPCTSATIRNPSRMVVP